MPTIKKLKDTEKKKNYNTENRKIRQSYYQTQQWRKLRLAHLMNFPICQRCAQHGIVTAGKDLHHLVSFMKGKTDDERQYLFLNDDNIITVCQYCHNVLHGQAISQFNEGDKYDKFIDEEKK